VRRRTLLATAAAALAGTAGCTSSGSESPGGTDRNGTTSTPSTSGPTTGEPTDDPTTDDPTTGDPNGEFDWGSCPSFAESADRTVCYYANRASSDVYLAPGSREFVDYAANDEVETQRLTLYNDSDRTFGLNPHEWAVKQWDDGKWTHVAPDEYVEPWYELEPGETYEWILSTEEGPGPMSENSMSVVVDFPWEDVQSGSHLAFAVDGLLGSGEDEEHLECVARFKYLRAVPNVRSR
jgi:hypothetical protein